MTIRDTIHRLLPFPLWGAGGALSALPSTRVTDDGSMWDILLSGGGPADRPWHDVAQDLDDALEAWRKNFLIRQIVRLTTALCGRRWYHD